KALEGRIPRAFGNHHTAEGALYGRLVRALLGRLGQLPVDAEPSVREWGSIAVELDFLGRESAELRRELTKVDTRRRKLRVQFARLQQDLERTAAASRPSASNGRGHEALLEALSTVPPAGQGGGS